MESKMSLMPSKRSVVQTYASEIEDFVRHIRRWMTESGRSYDEDEIKQKCEDIFFKSKLSYQVNTSETELLIESIEERVLSRYGILKKILDDNSVNEIMANGSGKIYIEKNRKLIKVDDAFTSDDELEDIIRMFASDVHREVNEANPIVDARLPSGYRVNGVLKTVALNGPILTIRKFREKEIEMKDLIEFGSISEECAKDLGALVKAGYNIFVSGGTSSGKTTFLNALSAFINEHERVITIEDSAELVISHIDNKVQLECRSANSIGKGEVSMDKLIRTSLRMRPDRIIVGEVRGSEVVDMIQAMNTGHDGSMSTGHGNSIKGMLNRLETMYLMDSALSIDAVKSQIANAIDIFVHLKRDGKGIRKVEEIAELAGFDHGEYEINYLYKTDENDLLKSCRSSLKDRERLIRAGFRGVLLYD